MRVLVSLATVYNIGLRISRESSDKDLAAAYKKIVLKAHPDKGGSEEHFKELQGAKENWDKARANAQANFKKGRTKPRSGTRDAADRSDAMESVPKASRIAARTLQSLRKSCLEVIKKKGSATKGYARLSCHPRSHSEMPQGFDFANGSDYQSHPRQAPLF